MDTHPVGKQQTSPHTRVWSPVARFDNCPWASRPERWLAHPGRALAAAVLEETRDDGPGRDRPPGRRPVKSGRRHTGRKELNRLRASEVPRDAEGSDSRSDGSHERNSGHGCTECPQELRDRAVAMYRSAEPKPQIKRLAIDLGVHPEALRGWIRQAEAGAGERDDWSTTAEREELAALRRENAQLRRANEILRTASASFAAQLDPTRPR